MLILINWILNFWKSLTSHRNHTYRHHLRHHRPLLSTSTAHYFALAIYLHLFASITRFCWSSQFFLLFVFQFGILKTCKTWQIQGRGDAVAVIKAQHGHGVQSDDVARDQKLRQIFLFLWRLQLGLVAAAHEPPVSEEEALRDGRARPARLPHRRMVSIEPLISNSSHAESISLSP